MEKKELIKFAQRIAMATLCSATSGAFAHTSVTPNTVNEGATANLNMVIGHGCHDANGAATIPITAQSVVFPDPATAKLTKGVSNNQAEPNNPDSYDPATGIFTDHVTLSAGAGLQAVQSDDVFDKKTVLEKISPGGANTLGYSYRGGKLPGNIAGFIPFRLDKVTIKSSSCANSVTFKLAVADICKNTPKASFNEHVVNFWTPNVGSTSFQGAEFSPPSVKVVRTSSNTCDQADQFDLIVWPTATQLNRDMPIPGIWGIK